MRTSSEVSRPFTRTSPAPDPANGARVLLETLARRGVNCAFGIPGGLCSPVFDAFREVPSFDVIYTRHEAMAGYAAIGHYVATGDPALAVTTGGPGLTNAITAVAAAFVDEVPMIVLSGETATTAGSRGAFQDATTNALDAVAMMRTVTRWSARVDSPQNIPGMIEQALMMATGPSPGPVYLALPVDVGLATCVSMPVAATKLAAAAPDPVACAEVAERLRRAKRPLIVAGNGARAAEPQLLELAERTCCPVVTTPSSKGVFPESHPLHLGMIGLGGHPSARSYIEDGPDVVCVVGSRLGEIDTDGWSLPLCGSEAMVQIDTKPCLVGRNYPTTLGVIGDIRSVLAEMIARLPSDVASPSRQFTGIALADPAAPYSDSVPLHPARVFRALAEAFPDAFFATDLGEHAVLALHYLPIDRSRRFRTMWGLGAMGSGIGMAIGAKHAKPRQTVVCICGDGGFAMHAGDLLSCVEQNIGVIFAIMNDGCWNMVEQGFASVYGRSPASMPARRANLDGVAREYGAVSARIEVPSDLDAGKLKCLASIRRPVVLDIRTDPSIALSRSGRNEAMKRERGRS